MISIPYPDTPQEPFWGPPTAKADFCEEDYLLTPYVAELFNAVTNAIYVYYGVRGLWRSRHRKGYWSSDGVPYWGLIGVGVCSAYFHTLRHYHAQMADDLSMHLATFPVLYRVMTFDADPAYERRARWGLLTFLIAFSAYHCLTDEVLVHTLIFGGTTSYIARLTSGIVARRIKDERAKSWIWKLEILGISSASLAYALWNIDMHFCGPLTKVKRSMGLPWGIALELHAWWHILTGVAAYTFIALTEYLTQEDLEEESGWAWPVEGRLVVRDGEKTE